MPIVDLDMPIRDYVAAFRSRPKTAADEAEGREAEAEGKMCWDAEEWLSTKPDRWTYGDALAAIPKEGKPLGWVLTSMTFTGARLTPPTVRLCHDIIIANTTVNNPGTGYRLYRDGAMTRAEKARLFGRLEPVDGPKHAATGRLKRQRGEEGIRPTPMTARG